MARIRSVKPEIRTSEKVNSWPIPLRYFWILLWGYADDYGSGRNNPKLIVADSFPLDDTIDADQVEAWMTALAEARVIRFYEVDDVSYFTIVNWAEHQKVAHPSKRVIPSPPESLANVSGIAREDFVSGSGDIQFGAGSMEHGGGGLPASSPFCSKHPTGTTSPCRACGDARKAFDAAAKVKPSTPPVRRQRECPQHEGYPHPDSTFGCDACKREAAELEAGAA